jgi:dTDP-glucose 4,6-dehydratase
VEGETFNLGAGREVTVAELAAEIIRQVGRPVRIEVDTSRLRPEKSEVQRLLSDNSLARQRLGWQPLVDLPVGLSQTIAWVSDHLGHYRPNEYQT